MEKYDVIVVGAGPAGSTAAKTIVENSDKSVLLLEQYKNPMSQCAGGIGMHFVDKLNLDIPKNIIQQEVYSIKVNSPNYTAEISKKDLGIDKLGYVLDRKKFDQWLIKEAIRSGVEYRNSSKFITALTMCSIRDKFSVKIDGGKVITDNLVDASGISAVVGKSLGMPVDLKKEDTHVGIQYVVDLPKDKDPNTLEFWFDAEKIHSGYAWSFPISKTRTKLGMGVDLNQRNVGSLLRDWIKDTEFNLDKIYDKGGGLIPTGKIVFSDVNGAYLIGDAGHFCSPLHGGGIAFAMISGRIAGEVISKNETNNMFNEKIRKDLGKLLSLHYRLKSVVYSLNNNDFDKIIRLLSEFKPKSMNLNREVLRLLWHILKKDPLFSVKILKSWS